MYYRTEIMSYLQSNNILANKLDHALTGVGNTVLNQIETIGSGAQRALYYTSCFTEEYQSVCQQQKTEDVRFRKSVVSLLKHGNIVFDMIHIYFEEILKYKTPEQIEHIKKMLMAVNIHIAANSLTKTGFVLATTTSVVVGMNLKLNLSVLIGRAAGTIITIAGLYGVVQKAADSANRLRFTYPEYYAALYTQELEMMYFIIEPIFEQAGALKASSASDNGIADIITNMIK